MTKNKRLTIFSKAEIAELFDRPIFTEQERVAYFALEADERKIMLSFGSIQSRIFFILQLGYFKARKAFFNIDLFLVKEDFSYIANAYFLGKEIPQTDSSQKARLSHQSHILNMYGYKKWSAALRKTLIYKALQLTRVSKDPKLIFNELIIFLENEKIIWPKYSAIQDIIGQALEEETQRLQVIIKQNLDDSTDKDLKNMLQADDDQKMYGIRLLKKDAKGFNTKEMVQEIQKQEASASLFEASQQIIPKLEISEQNIRHYALLVDYYTVDRLKELPYATVRLYLLCYVFYRFEKINDNLINSFIYHVNGYKDAAKKYSKDKVYHHKSEVNEYNKEHDEIVGFFTDYERFGNVIDFGKVSDKDFHLVPEEKFDLLKQTGTKHTFSEKAFQWEYYKIISRTITRNLRPLVQTLDFESEDLDEPLLKALTFLKEIFKSKNSLNQLDRTLFPKEFIPDGLKPYIYDDKSQMVLNVQKYEFLVYYQLEKSLKSGQLFVNNSFNFKSFKKDLLEDWEEVKPEILKNLNNKVLNTPIKEQLEAFKKELNDLIILVNQHIESGENKEIKIRKAKDGGQTWTLAYPKKNDEINNPFYEQFSQVSLSRVLRFANKHCNLMESFTHVKSRYAKTRADEEGLFACITANATGYGILKMSEISDISYARLLNTSKSFVRLETLKNANDKLVNHIAALPIFKHWNFFDDLLIASVDGKKIQSRLKHIIARHSAKYFGQKRGVVSYSMILNNTCLGTKIISPNDHESHHLFDLYYNNLSNLQANWLCGDTHSINQVNSFFMHVLNKKFTPHIKNIAKKSCSIASFGRIKMCENYLIIPSSMLSTKLIEDDWDSLQHIIASTLMKKTTQSVVVKKLSSHERSNKTQRALWEFDKILMSLHTLRFIDDPDYRRAIRTSLNRGEGYHQLTGKIIRINDGKFRGTTELELAIWNECIRFIANCIILYNAVLLSKLYEAHEKLGNAPEILEFIIRLSPIAWRHINLNGRYEFTGYFLDIDFDQMISSLKLNMNEKVAR